MDAKVAIISDIHGNLEALETVMADIKKEGADRILCLGDVVGYGPYPKECLEIVRKSCAHIVKGNHEDSVIFIEKGKFTMSPDTYAGDVYSRAQLSPSDLEFLSLLPETIIIPELDLTIAHGAYTEPSMHKYIEHADQIRKELRAIKTNIFCGGHTHIPYVFGGVGIEGKSEHDGSPYYLNPNNHFTLPEKQKFFINVGSVGQPRDRNEQASYGLMEIHNGEKFFSIKRISYDISKTKQAIIAVGLPSWLGHRLSMGE